MSLPAARIGDVTAHGGVITSGCPTVLIGNQPAARISDMHNCPLVTVLVPHIGGPLILGAFTVLVGGVPQSRISDTLICVGPPDAVVMGEPTVLVGPAGAGGLGGLLGVLLGGALAGITALLAGYPKAVLQPDGSYVTQYNTYITVEGASEYQAKVVRDLAIIGDTKSGQRLFASMEQSGKNCRIHTDQGKGNWAWTDPPPTGSNPPGYLQSDGNPGDASNTEIGYNPDRTSLNGPPGSPYNSAAWAQPPNRPADVGLYHEMVHADDMMHGQLDSAQGVNTGPLAGSSIPNSELRAAGLPPYEGADYSENAYRKERGLPTRDFY